MKFFIANNEREGTCYYEFVQGKWDEEALIFWSADSLYLHDDVLCELDLFRKLFVKAIPNFDCYCNMEVTRGDWERMVQIARDLGGQIAEFVEELRPWAEDNFRKYEVFTILGI